jgi:hypothetical protein
VLGWTTDGDEPALICRLPDGSAGTLPARWTDLPWQVEPAGVVGGIGSPAGSRLLLAHARELRRRRPRRGRAFRENGVTVAEQLALVIEPEAVMAAAVWEALPVERRLEVTVRLARLLARLVEAGRGE